VRSQWAELCWLLRRRQGFLPTNATPDVAIGYPFRAAADQGTFNWQ